MLTMSDDNTAVPLDLPYDEFVSWNERYARNNLVAWREAARRRLPNAVPGVATIGARNWVTSGVAWGASGRLIKAQVAYAAGVYAIYADGVLVYIGMAEQMSIRVSQHFYKRAVALERALGRSVQSWAVKYRPERFYGERATLELRLIRRLRPVLNRSGNRGHGDTERPALNRNNYRVKYAE